jgi:hypothetical protein
LIVKDIVSAGRRVAVGLASWLAGQEQALDNARRASTEVSRRRVERDEVAIYLDAMQPAVEDEVSTDDWSPTSAQAAD